MKIIFFGTPQEVIPVLEVLTENFNIAAVITTPDQKSGRKQILTASPVKIFVKKTNIPILTPQQFNNETIEQLQNFNPDLFIVAAYGKIIPTAVLTIPKYGAINIHPSLLPKYRGPTPLQTTLLNGDQQSGITFMKMDEQMDHGSILHQIPFTLENTDTFGWLMQSKFALAAQILPHVITDYVSGKLIPQPQDESQVTFTKMIVKQDGYIDLDNPPHKKLLDRMIRAYYPWPAVWTKAKINNREMILKFLPKQKLQVEGKNPVSLNDFLNGYPEMKKKLEKIFT
jgi:methionyl-tRNA formyltransferase